mmetsp:Transcript_3918/g.12163  ORF Transcript_3918/g.12163 Transcript_3918/m.12163 type:complete len:182 (-) Transcript_3918:72-617(-)
MSAMAEPIDMTTETTAPTRQMQQQPIDMTVDEPKRAPVAPPTVSAASSPDKKSSKDLFQPIRDALAAADAAAAEAFAAGDREGCHDILTKHAIAAGQKATETWRALWAELLVTFIDGRITVRNDDDHICGCSKDTATFTDAWKTKVVADTGDKYLEPEDAKGLAASAGGGRPKLSIRGVVA